MIQTQKCSDCNTFVSTFAKKPYCRSCTKIICCMSTFPNCDGRYSCNCSFDLHTFNESRYCLGHFKALQNKCTICDIPRPENDIHFQHDYTWACYAHRFEHKKKSVNAIYTSLKHILCIDVIIEIMKNVLLPVKNRYPDSFNIPFEKSLKQHAYV